MRSLVIFAAAFMLIIARAAPATAAPCQFVLGFKALHDLIPATVGACLVDEHHNPVNGDGLQETAGPTGAGGLLVWRKADNWTAYTDGFHTWINGPLGLQERLNTGPNFPWEAPATPTQPQMQCPPFQTDHIGLGGNIVYRRSVYIPVGYGLYGNVQIYGSNATLGFSIEDSNGSVLWGRVDTTGSRLIIFDPKYSDTYRLVFSNSYGSDTKTLVLNWRVCPVPSA